MLHNERQLTIDSYVNEKADFTVLDEVCQKMVCPIDWRSYYDNSKDSFALTLTFRPNTRIWDGPCKVEAAQASPRAQYKHLKRIIGRIDIPKKVPFTIVLFEEFTLAGVIHFHGIIQCSKYIMTKWCNAYKKASGAFILLKPIDNFNKWAEYCTKEQEDADAPIFITNREIDRRQVPA